MDIINYSKIKKLDERVDGILTTPAEGISNEEIIEARQGKPTLGKNVKDISDKANKTETDLTALKENYVQQRQQDQLKVSTVEKGLNDYKSTMTNVNVNQEVKQKVTDYGTISLPKNTANGQVSMSMKGRTYANILGTHATKDNTLNLASGGNVLLKGDGGIAGVGSNKLIKLIAGNRYLVKIDFLTSTTNNLNMLRAYSGTVISSDSQLGTLITSGLSSYVVFTAPGTDTVSFAFRNNVADSSYYHDKSIIVDLTSIGETETDINKLIQKYSYVSNTKSTISASRVKSVGKNLFDGKLELGIIDGVTGKNTELADRMRSKNYIQVKPSTSYKTVGSGGYVNFAFYFYDENKNYISFTSSSVGIFTTPTNAKYVRLRTSIAGQNDINVLIMLNEGTIAIPYEPYTESTSYLPNVGELRSINSNAKDEVRVSGNKAELVKRVSDVIKLDDKLDFTFVINKVGYKVFAFTAPTNANNTPYIHSVVGGLVLSQMPTVEVNNNVYLTGGKIRIALDNTITGFADGYTPTITEIKTFFSSISATLTYQLAQEIVTPIQTSGNLISYPSGTIYVENVVADAGVYSTKFNIKQLELPIKSVDKLIKYNFETGVQTVLDASLAVINVDKKSFTHPNLTNKDMVFVDYFYDVESTLGETTIEYLDSRHTIKDTTNDKFYSWDIKSTNGVPTVALTEVL